MKPYSWLDPTFTPIQIMNMYIFCNNTHYIDIILSFLFHDYDYDCSQELCQMIYCFPLSPIQHMLGFSIISASSRSKCVPFFLCDFLQTVRTLMPY